MNSTKIVALCLNSIVVVLCIPLILHAQGNPSVLQCECIDKINNDFLSDRTFGHKKWSGFEKATPLRDKVFSNLQSDNPIIKSITPPSKYFPEGEINEFEGSLIHRSDSILMIKWENPVGNKVWIATLNFELKKAIVTESYTGLTSFGINAEIFDCK